MLEGVSHRPTKRWRTASYGRYDGYDRYASVEAGGGGDQIPRAGADLGALQIGTLQLDFDFAELPVGRRIGRLVAERVPGSELVQDLCVELVYLIRRRRKEFVAAGLARDLLHAHLLRHPAAARLVLEVADRVDDRVAKPQQILQLVERHAAGAVAAVGVQQDHVLSGATERSFE